LIDTRQKNLKLSKIQVFQETEMTIQIHLFFTPPNLPCKGRNASQ
jgi:hypothetical protein